MGLKAASTEKERKKEEARKKFEDKQAKTAAASALATSSKTKEKKAKQDLNKDEILPDFEWYVGTGKKKGMSLKFTNVGFHFRLIITRAQVI